MRRANKKIQTQYYCYGCFIDTTGVTVVKVYVDEISSARIWQHKFCVTLTAIEIIHGSQNVF
jgi:hypothetical protein